MKKLALTTLLLNVADLLNTYIILNSGGIEANPLILLLLDSYGWVLTGLIKLSIVGLGLFALYKAKSKRGLILVTVCYAIVIVYQSIIICWYII
jgi:hypothetical protein